MVSKAKVMRDPAESARWEAAISYACKQPIRYVNECTGGEWRLQLYVTTIGNWFDSTPGPKRIQMPADWRTAINSDLTGTIADAPAGIWLVAEMYNTATMDFAWSGASSAMAHAVSYVERFWGTLVICKERDEPGAAQAWQTVYGTGNNDSAGITNIDAWLASWGDAPIYNRLPRNLP
jgi:hypothetical protein